MKHTPGPWEINDQRLMFEILADSKAIATVWVHDVGRNEGEANALLMSVAPDLLKALRYLLHCYCEIVPGSELEEEVIRARSAIMKTASPGVNTEECSHAKI